LPEPPLAFDPAGDCLAVANAFELNDAPRAEGGHVARATCPPSGINGGNRFFVPNLPDPREG
jgi:hypothetical protein